MQGRFDNIKIQGIVSAVPTYVEENTIYAPVIGAKRAKKQIRMTGVSRRRIPKRYQRVSDLCYRSARNLIDNLEWKEEDIKVLVYITQGPNYVLPSTAFFLQERLGIPVECVAFDVNLGCSSFNMGVEIVASLLKDQPTGSKGLLLVGDLASGPLNSMDLLTPEAVTSRMLFGAAGAATALEVVDSKEDGIFYMNRSDGTGKDAIMRQIGGQTHMDGAAVFEFAVNEVSKCVIDFKKAFDIAEDEIDYYVFHQAQKLILDNIIDICDIEPAKELRSLEDFGNTSGTSVPVSMCVNRQAYENKENIRFICSGFGVGLSWGCVSFSIPSDRIYPLIETDEHYDDDKVNTPDNHYLIVGADTEMGQYLSCSYGYRNSLLLAGKDVECLQEIKDSTYMESSIYAASTYSNAMLGEYSESDEAINAIVIADNRLSVGEIATLLKAIKEEKDAFTKEVAVLVIVGNDNQEELSKLIVELNEAWKMEGWRTNGMTVNFEDFDFMPNKGEGQEWLESYLEKDMPIEMERAVTLQQNVSFLLNKGARYVSGIVVPFECRDEIDEME